jgi:formylmethanofuran dehydrogenase subunit C
VEQTPLDQSTSERNVARGEQITRGDQITTTGQQITTTGQQITRGGQTNVRGDKNITKGIEATGGAMVRGGNFANEASTSMSTMATMNTGQTTLLESTKLINVAGGKQSQSTDSFVGSNPPPQIRPVPPPVTKDDIPFFVFRFVRR